MTDRTLAYQLLDDLIPLIQRFPDLPVSNSGYNRNFVEILFNLHTVENHISAHMQALRPEKTARYCIRYQQQADAVYDAARLQRLMLSFRADHQMVSDSLRGHFQSIESDLSRLKQSAQFNNLAKRLIRISPLIYSASGEALPSSYLNASQHLEPEELQTLYYDTFEAHLSKLFRKLSQRKGFGKIEQLATNISNQFIPRELIPTTTRYTSDSIPIRERVLTLEEAPPIYAPLRGALAGDCSMLTVPYFGILSNTRTFWVHRNSSSQSKPIGYLFIAEIPLKDGALTPYIITINGPKLGNADCNAIFFLLGEIYRTQHILIADVRKIPYLVNSPRIETAMASLGGERIRVKLPDGWEAISSWRANTVAYENFYARERLGQPRRVKTRKLVLFKPRMEKPVKADFYPEKRIDKLELINRALIAHYFRQSPVTGIDDTTLRQLLDLDEIHLQHGETIVELYQGGHFRIETFNVLKKHFGFTIKDYARLPFSVRISSLTALYNNYQADTTIPQQYWSELCRKTFNEVKTLGDQNQISGDELLQQLSSIPDEFIDEYWEVLSPYFLMHTGRVDYFRLRMVVKNFRSRATVTSFVEFLLSYPEAMEAVKPEDPRWFDYLERLKTLAPEHPAIPHLFQTLFHDQPLNTDISMSASEVEQRYQAARILDWAIDESLIDMVFEKRGWH